MAKIYGEIGASALMTFDKSFARSNGQPLDSTEVFYSKSAAETYAAGEVAYVGQKVVVVETVGEVTKVTHYGIEPDNSLKELGSSPVGDESTIVVAEDGTVSLAGISGLEFTEKNEAGEDVAVNYQPLLTSAGLTWVKPSATTVEGLASEIEGLKTRLGTAEGKITTLEGKAHTHENEDVLKGITSEKVTAWDAAQANAEAAAKNYTDGKNTAMDTRVKAIEDDYLKGADKTELQGNIDTVSGKVTKLIGEDADKSVRTIANEELAKQLIPEGANAARDTLAEIAAWIQSHPGDASAMNEAIVALQNKVNTGDKTVTAYVDEAITALKIGDYAKASELTALAARVKAVEDDYLKGADKTELAGDITAGDTQTLKDAKAYADGLAGNYDAKGSASQALADAKAYADGLAGNYDSKGAAAQALADAKAYADGLAGNYDAKGAAASAEANAKGYASELNTAMDTRMQAVEGAKHTHANKTVLDNISADNVAAWNAKSRILYSATEPSDLTENDLWVALI